MNDSFFSISLPSNIPFTIQFHRIFHDHKHWHSTVELLFILKGSVEAEVQETVSHLTEGDLLLINRKEIHELKSTDNGLTMSMELDLYKFDLSRSEADGLYFLCDSSRDKNPERYDNLRSLLALIIERNAVQDDANRYDNKSFAYSMLKELTQNFQAPASQPRPKTDKHLERMNHIVRYIDEHYRENLRLGDLAEVMHLTMPYLSALFSKYLGTTYTNYYNSVRMGYAIQDLVSTDDPIDTIAPKHGFPSPQAFSRSFKAAYGMLPSAYRKQHHSVQYSTGKVQASYIQGISETTTLDLSALTRYLPSYDQQSRPIATPPASVTQVAADWNSTVGTFGSAWNKMIGVGSAKQILFREIQQQLTDLQRQIGFTHIKFHGIFSDEMMVGTRAVTGELLFNFRTVDMVLDFLFSIGLTPFLELSFMPIELAKDRNKMVINNRYNTSQPARLEEWLDLVREFFLHLITRYGQENVESMPVTIWNNADSSTDMYGMQEDLVFFQLYQETFLTIKKINPRIQVGGPAMTFMDNQSIQWAYQFYRWEMDHNITPDFFCAQYYAVTNQPLEDVKIDLRSWTPNHMVSARKESSYSLVAGIPLSTDPDNLKRLRQFLDNFLAQLGLDRLPLWITEWNLTVNHNNLLNDTVFAGCYVIKNVLEHSQGLQALSYWSASDFIEEQVLPIDVFHGGLGLMTVDGIHKPQFLAYQMLRQLKQQIVAQSEGYIITHSDHVLSALFYNYEHFNDLFASNKTYNVNATSRYTPFPQQKRRRFLLRLTQLPTGPVREAVEFVVNRDNGSAYDYWLRMGAPQFGSYPPLDDCRLANLKAQARPLIQSFRPKIEHGILTYEATLEPLEFRLTQIIFE